MDKELIKLWYVYTMEYHLSVKRKILIYAAVWMNLENIK